MALKNPPSYRVSGGPNTVTAHSKRLLYGEAVGGEAWSSRTHITEHGDAPQAGRPPGSHLSSLSPAEKPSTGFLVSSVRNRGVIASSSAMIKVKTPRRHVISNLGPCRQPHITYLSIACEAAEMLGRSCRAEIDRKSASSEHRRQPVTSRLGPMTPHQESQAPLTERLRLQQA